MRSGAESAAGHRLVPIEPLDPRSFPPTFEDDVCREGRRAVRFRLQAQSDGVIAEGLFGRVPSTTASFPADKKGGGYLGHKGKVPAGRFNAGQKMFYWYTAAFGIVISVSGVMLVSRTRSNSPRSASRRRSTI